MDKKLLKHQLQSNVGIVTFTKSDGSERVMRCTLHPSVLPLKSADDIIIDDWLKPEQNEKILAVWDLENKGWRSIRIDRITKAHFYSANVEGREI